MDYNLLDGLNSLRNTLLGAVSMAERDQVLAAVKAKRALSKAQGGKIYEGQSQGIVDYDGGDETFHKVRAVLEPGDVARLDAETFVLMHDDACTLVPVRLVK